MPSASRKIRKSSSVARTSSNMKQGEKWRILDDGLPDTIFVRAYESRMDLLWAVIIGPEGTPYHDGLFFFDVLVSIQGLILSAKPYFNEPGFERSSGSPSGEYWSMLYNEQTLIYSLKTMVYTMNKPPKVRFM
ncbi:hypothetical protein LXL04_039374 [Taraxacum kok-saghyz]